MLIGLGNSIAIVGAAVLIGAVLGVPAAYAIARYPIRGKRDIQFFLLSLRFLPPVAVALPLIAIWVDLGLYDTKLSMIVTYLLVTLSTITWLSIPVFRRLPREIEKPPRSTATARTRCSGISRCRCARARCSAASCSASCWCGTN